MSKPVTTGAEVAPITFDQRVQLVHEEIQRRKAETSPSNPAHYVARLWVNWIKRNILDVPALQEVQP